MSLATEDLVHEADGLLSLAGNSPVHTLSELTLLAARRVPGCCGASAALWEAGGPSVLAASHPDIPPLIDAQVRSGRGPVLAALATGLTTGCPDTLHENRWPEYAGEALPRGVRCSVTLAHHAAASAVTLSLYAVRPNLLEADQLALAGLLVAVGGAMVGNVSRYIDARRAAVQMRDAARSRVVVDQAKGVLMQALGCSAREALGRMREISQHHGVRVTDVARQIITAHAAEGRPAV